jgi:spoIIIJ-associated protein
VTFQVITEGQRGLLGVGYTPARVLAQVDVDPTTSVVLPAAPVEGDSEAGAHVREVVSRIASEIGVPCAIEIEEDDESLTASVTGDDLGLLIGKHGQTIDAIQQLVNAIVHRGEEAPKPVVVDAGGYRRRRQATLDSLATRSADQARETGEAVALEPMSSVERKLVHLCLKDVPGIETRSEGDEPNRFVVIAPSRD